jgi:gliding motility-associated-like protein
MICRCAAMVRLFACYAVVGLGGFLAAEAAAQTCDSPLPACGSVVEDLSLATPTTTAFGCMTLPYVTVLEFTSNANTDFTGPVEVAVRSLSCSGPDGADTVWVQVVKPDPQSLCDAAAYVAVSPCLETTAPATVVSEALFPNATYLVLVGTRHDPALSACGISIEITGPAVSIDVCCTATIAPGGSVELTASGGDPSLGYVWFPTQGLSSPSGAVVEASPTGTITYGVTGFVGACSYSDAVTVTVGIPLELPNGFTPNDDGFNDLWEIGGTGAFPKLEVLVYDRAGQLVHRNIGYVQPWDGKRNGVPVPAGTYYYVIDLNEPQVDLDPFTGYVSIIR